MELNDSMDYKNLTTAEFELLLESMRYILMDYANFIEEREPYATNAIKRLQEVAFSLPEDELLKQFILYLDKQ